MTAQSCTPCFPSIRVSCQGVFEYYIGRLWSAAAASVTSLLLWSQVSSAPIYTSLDIQQESWLESGWGTVSPSKLENGGKEDLR